MLAHLIGPVVFEEKVSHTRGRTLAPYAIVRVPPLPDPEGAGRIRPAVPQDPPVRGRGACREGGRFSWKDDLARRARTDLEAKEVLQAYRRKLAIVTAPGRSCGASKTSSACTAPTRW